MNKILFLLFFSLVVSQQPSNELQRNMLEKARKTKNISFESELKQANTLERNGMLEEAERIYIDILSKDPTYSRAYRKLRNMLKKQDRMDELVTLAEDYASIQPVNSTAQIELMEVYIWVENNKWVHIAEHVFKKFRSRESVIKLLNAKLISNGHLDQAIEYVSQFREKDADFYTIELGTYFNTRMAYDKSTIEFLEYLKYNPEKYQVVYSRIISIPDDPFIQKKVKNILNKSKVKGAKLLLSDLEFRSGNFREAYDLLNSHYQNPAQLLEFANQVFQAADFSFSLKVYSDIIDSDFNPDIIRSAVFGMAQVFEAQTVSSETDLPISGFFKGNDFFESPYFIVNEALLPSMWKAVSIYDSLRTNKNGSDATYRLAEIKFRAMNDLDSAFELYSEIVKKSRQRSIRFLAGLRIIDLYLAKGDIDSAKEQILGFMEKFKSKEELEALQIKKSQIQFYAGELDSVRNSLGELMKTLSKEDHRYNDLLDVQSSAIAFRDHPELFITFTDVQLLLRQNKRTLAIDQLEKLFDSPITIIAHMAVYQSAILNMLQGDLERSIELTESIEGPTIFVELSRILKAEIFDYKLNHTSDAIDVYLQFLGDYPLSIYYDDIRLRLRKLAS